MDEFISIKERSYKKALVLRKVSLTILVCLTPLIIYLETGFLFVLSLIFSTICITIFVFSFFTGKNWKTYELYSDKIIINKYKKHQLKKTYTYKIDEIKFVRANSYQTNYSSYYWFEIYFKNYRIKHFKTKWLNYYDFEAPYNYFKSKKLLDKNYL